MFFNTFVSERGPAWRACDLFDDLHQNIGEHLRLEEIGKRAFLNFFCILCIA